MEQSLKILRKLRGRNYLELTISIKNSYCIFRPRGQWGVGETAPLEKQAQNQYPEEKAKIRLGLEDEVHILKRGQGHVVYC